MHIITCKNYSCIYWNSQFSGLIHASKEEFWALETKLKHEWRRKTKGRKCVPWCWLKSFFQNTFKDGPALQGKKEVSEYFIGDQSPLRSHLATLFPVSKLHQTSFSFFKMEFYTHIGWHLTVQPNIIKKKLTKAIKPTQGTQILVILYWWNG